MRRIISIACICMISLLPVITLGCGGSKKESLETVQEARKRAIQGKQNVAERNREARRIVNEKYEAMSKIDSRFEGYAPGEEEEVLTGEDGTLAGSVVVWEAGGEEEGNSAGITVMLRNDVNGSSRRTRVDSYKTFAFSVPPGDYTLIVDERGYEYFEKYVTVFPGTEQLMDPIDLERK